MVFKRINLNIKLEDCCSYKGKCLKELNVSNDLCRYCKYNKKLDIPKMIEDKLKENVNG